MSTPVRAPVLFPLAQVRYAPAPAVDRQLATFVLAWRLRRSRLAAALAG